MKNLDRFYSSVGLLLVLNLLIKPAWIFGIDLQVQNIIGTKEYGNYFAILNLSIVFSFLTDWGFTIFFNRSASALPAVYLKRAVSYCLLKILFALVYMAVVFAIAFFSGINDWFIVLMVILIQVLTSFYLFLRSMITAMQKFKTEAWLSVLDKFLMILVCGTFIYLPFVTGTITLQKFLVTQVVSLSVALIITVFILASVKISFEKINPKYLNVQLFKAAFPFALIVFLMSVHNRLDGFLLERLHPDGNYEAGMYAAAYRLLDAFLMPGNMVIAILLPFVARQFEQRKVFVDFVLNVRHFLMMLTAGISTIGFVLALWIQNLLYEHDPVYGATVLRLSLLSMSGYTLIQVYGTVLTATGHIRQFVNIIFFTVILNIILNVLLIPQLGAKASAIASIITQHLSGLYLLFLVSKQFNLPVNIRSVFLYIFSIALYALILFIGIQLNMNEWLLIICCLVAGFLTILFTKTPDWRKMLIR